jgi:hypothetical protein
MLVALHQEVDGAAPDLAGPHRLPGGAGGPDQRPQARPRGRAGAGRAGRAGRASQRAAGARADARRGLVPVGLATLAAMTAPEPSGPRRTGGLGLSPPAPRPTGIPRRSGCWWSTTTHWSAPGW